jgi:transposase-like protein
MGVFDKLFGGNGKKESVAVKAPPCPHSALVPRWDNVHDMGSEDRASRFICEACHEEFTPAQASALRQGSVTDRLVYQAEAEDSNFN